MKKTDIKKLFKGIKCSLCGKDFDDNSFTIMRKEDGLFVLQVKCKKCCKGFGIALLGLDKKELTASLNETVAIVNNKCTCQEIGAISYDDILDAHEFIKNLDENWRNFVAKKKKS